MKSNPAASARCASATSCFGPACSPITVYPNDTIAVLLSFDQRAPTHSARWCTGQVRSAMLRIREIEAAAGVPLRTLVAVGGDPAGVSDHAGQVQQVPRHECGVPVGEVVLRAARSLIKVGRAGAGFADPAGVGLGRDHVAEGLERIEDVLSAVLHPVLR